MFRTFLICLIFVTGHSAFAERFTSRLHAIDRGDKGELHLLKFENGRTAFVSSGAMVEVEVDDNLELRSFASVEAPAPAPETDSAFEEFFTYEPTELENMSSATGIFRRMNRNHQRASQCYNRAHVWAYEEYQRTQWKSMKLFLFFTDRYIRNYRYKWWFHVTPMARVGTQNFAMDRTFTSGPLPIKDWTDIFIYSKRQCPVVHKYSDYEDHQWAEDCYLIPVSMYYWQPRDIDRFERTGKEKTEFIRSEVNHAYWEAF
jgi:hypothetical protein